MTLRDACQQIINSETSRKSSHHDKLTVLDAQTQVRTSAETNLLCQTTRDPHPETIALFLVPCLHGTTMEISRVHRLCAAVFFPPSLCTLAITCPQRAAGFQPPWAHETEGGGSGVWHGWKVFLDLSGNFSGLRID